MVMELLTKIVEHLPWPTAVVLLGWMFKKEIKALFTRLEKFRGPGDIALEFSLKQHAENELIAESVKSEKGVGQWQQKVASTFWLAHDLIWTIDVMLRGAPKQYIIYGLRQSLHHITEIGLSESSFGSKLKRLNEIAEESIESDWTEEKRHSVATDLFSLRDELGALVKLEQPDYRPS